MGQESSSIQSALTQGDPPAIPESDDVHTSQLPTGPTAATNIEQFTAMRPHGISESAWKHRKLTPQEKTEKRKSGRKRSLFTKNGTLKRAALASFNNSQNDQDNVNFSSRTHGQSDGDLTTNLLTALEVEGRRYASAASDSAAGDVTDKRLVHQEAVNANATRASHSQAEGPDRGFDWDGGESRDTGMLNSGARDEQMEEDLLLAQQLQEREYNGQVPWEHNSNSDLEHDGHPETNEDLETESSEEDDDYDEPGKDDRAAQGTDKISELKESEDGAEQPQSSAGQSTSLLDEHDQQPGIHQASTTVGSEALKGQAPLGTGLAAEKKRKNGSSHRGGRRRKQKKMLSARIQDLEANIADLQHLAAPQNKTYHPTTHSSPVQPHNRQVPEASIPPATLVKPNLPTSQLLSGSIPTPHRPFSPKGSGLKDLQLPDITTRQEFAEALSQLSKDVIGTDNLHAVQDPDGKLDLSGLLKPGNSNQDLAYSLFKKFSPSLNKVLYNQYCKMSTDPTKNKELEWAAVSS